MLKQIWRIRAMYACRQRVAGLTISNAWDIAGTLTDTYRPNGYTPTDAVREDMTYWQT